MALQRDHKERPSGRIDPDKAYTRICRYCAYQERSHKEVRGKLFSYGLFPSEVEQTISRLITEGFLNEERFAKSFAGGKFRMQKWGKHKIKRALEMHGLSSRCIERGLREIENGAYAKTLRSLLTKKLQSISEPNLFKARQKAAHYAIGKGFEPELVWELLKEMDRD